MSGYYTVVHNCSETLDCRF